MKRKTPHVPEPDDDSQQDDDSRSSWFWSIIYSVITHPFRVIGNLLGLSRRWTSEDHSPGNVQDTIGYREEASTSEPLEVDLDGSLNLKDYLPGNVQDHEDDSPDNVQDTIEYRARRRTFEDHSPGNVQDTIEYLEPRGGSLKNPDSIEKIKTEKPVAILHPAPPAPPPPNPPV